MTVRPSFHDNVQLALDIRRGQWLVSDAETLFPLALQFLSRVSPDVEAHDFTLMHYAADGRVIEPGATGTTTRNKSVAVVPLRGVLTKYSTCTSVGTTTVAAKLLQVSTDENVAGIVLDIDSGGGACNSVAVMVEAIRKVKASGKPIIAHCDFCGSAAYWIASQCDSIFADNELSEFGSIGVMSQIVDNTNLNSGERVITVYAKESSDKNLPYRKALEGDYELLQSKMSPIVEAFHVAVKSSRKNLSADAPGVLSGAMFYAADAKRVGLIDNIMTLEESIENVFVRDECR